MSKVANCRKISVPKIRAMKGKDPIVCLTAYTAPIAGLVDRHVDLILVGDSLGMVIHGFSSTIDVTLEHMIMHGQAVVRGSKQALVVVDMPFGSFEESPQTAHKNAVRIMKETGCTAVKIEGGVEMAETIAFMTKRGIPVMAHIGLMPQSTRTTGGYKVVGRNRSEWQRVIADAEAVAEAGAFCVVLEGVAEPLAAEITKIVSIPTIGIGASNQCDGQILVIDDMLGMFEWTPKFVKEYGDLRHNISDAVSAYAADVRCRQFPSSENTYAANDTIKDNVTTLVAAS